MTRMQPCRRFLSPPGFDPPELFRYFPEEWQADALCRGDVWVSTLEACRKHEGSSRGDPGEATRTYFSGVITGSSGDRDFEEVARRGGISIGPGVENAKLDSGTYRDRVTDGWLICFSESICPDGLPGIGRFGVRIQLPRLFFRHVTNALRLADDIELAALGRVRYADRNYRHLDPVPGPIAFVKPPDQYSDQHEVRMLWNKRDRRAILQSRLLPCHAIARLCSRI